MTEQNNSRAATNLSLESEEGFTKLLRLWESGELPRSCWTHSAHVAVAAYYAHGNSPELTFEKMKFGILHFNECVGTANTEDSGYHETLTRFWSGIVSEFVKNGRFSSCFEAVNAAVKQFGTQRNLHL